MSDNTDGTNNTTEYWTYVKSVELIPPDPRGPDGDNFRGIRIEAAYETRDTIVVGEYDLTWTDLWYAGKYILLDALMEEEQAFQEREDS